MAMIYSTTMSSDNYYTVPDLEGEDAYTDPLTVWVDEKVVVEWAGRSVKGTVVDVELPHEGHSFDEYLLVAPDSGGATISVDPSNILSSTREL